VVVVVVILPMAAMRVVELPGRAVQRVVDSEQRALARRMRRASLVLCPVAAGVVVIEIPPIVRVVVAERGK
jgi:hypothetical protein